MIIVSRLSCRAVAQEIASSVGLSFVLVHERHFANKEFDFYLDSLDYNLLVGREIIIINTVHHALHDELFALMLIADLFHRVGAKMLTLVAPFFPYMRQDKKIPGKAHPPSLLFSLLYEAGITRLVTLDMHVEKSITEDKLKIFSLAPSQLFLEAIRVLEQKFLTEGARFVIVAPDHGALTRAQSYASFFNVPLVFFTKVRTPDGHCSLKKMHGDVRYKHCIIIDDIIDSGQTVRLVTQELLTAQAVSVRACITHALLTESTFHLLLDTGLVSLYTTDSVSLSFTHSKCTQLKIISLLSSWISAYNTSK